MSTLIINEIFYSIQGESYRTGLPTHFVRLTGCPLRCSYCDTEYAFKSGTKMTFDEIISQLNINITKFVTITGGEPLAQKSTLEFMNKLCDLEYSVSLETSNCFPIEDIDPRASIILDIKTPGSKEENKNIITNYQRLKSSDEIKFVICNLNDFNWAVDYMHQHKLDNYCSILFSPSYGEMPLQELAELILENSLKVRLQTQLHKTIWGEVNGK